MAFDIGDTITSASGSATVSVASALRPSQPATQVTGVDTSNLSHVWLHKSRLWFVEKDTTKAHYLPAASIGGAVATLNLGSVFTRGGVLLSGDRWSVSDSGDGQDDLCVFLSSEGEVAIYEGTDPSSASTWALVGVYYIGRPLGRRPFMRAGGDLVVATAEGMVPLSLAVVRDPAALSMAAISRPIEPHWKLASLTHDAGQWEIVKNTARGFAVVIYPAANPNDRGVLAVNIETGAWARWTWPATCGCEHDQRTWFGTADGKIGEMESGGTDFGASYETKIAMAPNHLGQIGSYKHVHMVRGTFIARTSFRAKISLGNNYQPRFPSPPSGLATVGDGNWGSAVWGATAWGGIKTVTTRWVSINRNCEVATLQVQCSIDDAIAPSVELASIDVLFDAGGVVV